MGEAIGSILAVAGLAFIVFGVYQGVPALKQKSGPEVNAAFIVLLPFGLVYWIAGVVLLSLKLST